jgi:phosphopantothenoylcysteine synthetase/decarboxylase
MNILVTAGNTQVPIDRVRCLTNVFTGRTGAAIARHAYDRGHAVTLLTSHPEAAAEFIPAPPPVTLDERFWCARYSTFDDLQKRMAEFVAGLYYDAVIHCAAVSDYLAGGVYAPDPHTHFSPEDGRWSADGGDGPRLLDRQAGKVKSDEPELWLRLVRAPKLIDRVRADWGFRGVLVKFKLEVGVSDERLLEVAERSRTHSGADLMVANTLEGSAAWAFVGPLGGGYKRVSRGELPARLLEAVEALHAGRAGHV